ncbi:MAG: BON domain-containing protein [Gemmatimonadaceae bacterium]|jgi:hypothetical protein|nr:BON domain-containing protein [Gemmatimonadaceae bacterium]
MPRRLSASRSDDPNGLYILVAALGGLAAGYLLATRTSGIDGLRRRWRALVAEDDARPEPAHGAHEPDDDELWDDDSPYGELEARVLEAFRHDPVLAHRAVDITATGPDAIELNGWVRREAEAEHAVTIARGTPGVERVESRVRVKAAR